MGEGEKVILEMEVGVRVEKREKGKGRGKENRERMNIARKRDDLTIREKRIVGKKNDAQARRGKHKHRGIK